MIHLGRVLLPATGIAASSLTAAASSLTGQLEEIQSKRTVVQSPNLTCSKLAVKTFCLFCIDLRPSDNENNKNKNKNERHQWYFHCIFISRCCNTKSTKSASVRRKIDL